MEFTHHNEPYGTVTFNVETVTLVKAPISAKPDSYMRFREANGWLELKGTVNHGGETSRLGQHSHTRDLAGEPYTLQVPPKSYGEGFRRTIAM